MAIVKFESKTLDNSINLFRYDSKSINHSLIEKDKSFKAHIYKKNINKLIKKLDILSNKSRIVTKNSEIMIIKCFLCLLSPSETIIATKSVQGFLNKQVAKFLKVSEKTVKFHLGNIFRKLNIRKRGQLLWCLPVFNSDFVRLKVFKNRKIKRSKCIN